MVGSTETDEKDFLSQKTFQDSFHVSNNETIFWGDVFFPCFLSESHVLNCVKGLTDGSEGRQHKHRRENDLGQT